MKNKLLLFLFLGITSLRCSNEQEVNESNKVKKVKHALTKYIQDANLKKKPEYDLAKGEVCPVQILNIFCNCNGTAQQLPLQAQLELKKIEGVSLLQKGEALPIIKEHLIGNIDGTYSWKS